MLNDLLPLCHVKLNPKPIGDWYYVIGGPPLVSLCSWSWVQGENTHRSTWRAMQLARPVLLSSTIAKLQLKTKPVNF